MLTSVPVSTSAAADPASPSNGARAGEPIASETTSSTPVGTRSTRSVPIAGRSPPPTSANHDGSGARRRATPVIASRSHGSVTCSAVPQPACGETTS